MRNMTVAQVLASAIQARKNCDLSGNAEWFTIWNARIHKLEKNFLPSGSGIDSGTSVSFDYSHGEKLVLYTSYHHMNGNGYYDGWTEHTVTVTPSFSGLNIRISGRNRNDIKDYLHDTFYQSLMTVIRYDEEQEKYVLVSE